MNPSEIIALAALCVTAIGMILNTYNEQRKIKLSLLQNKRIDVISEIYESLILLKTNLAYLMELVKGYPDVIDNDFDENDIKELMEEIVKNFSEVIKYWNKGAIFFGHKTMKIGYSTLIEFKKNPTYVQIALIDQTANNAKLNDELKVSQIMGHIIGLFDNEKEKTISFLFEYLDKFRGVENELKKILGIRLLSA